MTATAPRAYAGAVSRAVAYLMDVLVVGVLFTGGAALVGVIAAVVGARWRDIAPAAAVCVAVLPALLAAYWALFWALAGRTPGMAVLGMRVVATGRHRLSWPAALVRALVLAYFPIGAVWSLVDRRQQGVHDKVARTTVVRVPWQPRRPPAR
ncbi:RDD family protein [Nucisporomicrobium flavum]|uniref:RDD family protein n=1 Tax=Nucisporomicrobium flavum TaxID=2785915 RepID=UPI0027DB92F7|nr:RDD family protein [Nucisporomicrobium flavum]